MIQREFGRSLGVSRTLISSYENTANKPKGDFEERVCERYKLTRHELYHSDLSKGLKAIKLPTIDKRIETLEVQVATDICRYSRVK